MIANDDGNPVLEHPSFDRGFIDRGAVTRPSAKTLYEGLDAGKDTDDLAEFAS